MLCTSHLSKVKNKACIDYSRLFANFNFYFYYNNTDQPKAAVLIFNEQITNTDIIIAWLRSQPGQKKKWIYLKFNSLLHFMRTCYTRMPIIYRKFYIMFTNPKRNFYLDIDCVHYNSSLNKLKYYFIKHLKCIISDSIRCHFDDIFIWCSNRAIGNNEFKLSLHVIVPSKRYNNLQELRNVVMQIQLKIDKRLEIFHTKSGIDFNVYGNDIYQLWKLPENHDGDIFSTLTLFSNNPISLYKQFSMNICHQQGINWRPIEHKQSKSKSQTLVSKVGQTYTFDVIISLYPFIFNNDSGGKRLSKYLLLNYPDVKWSVSQNTRINKDANKWSFYLQNYCCPIKGAIHKRNRTRIDIFNHFDFFCLKCMDTIDCGIQYYYVSLSLKYNYPWLFYHKKWPKQNTQDTLLIDDYIKKAFIFKFIFLKNKYDNKELILYDTIKERYNDCKIRFKFSDNIVCYCKHIGIEFELRGKFHQHARKFNKVFLYCHYCRQDLETFIDNIVD